MRQRRPLLRHGDGGFTYVDLLVGIAVVMLAGTMALGQLFGGRERSNRVKCASNLRMIGMGMILYANDNKGLYPRVRADRGKEIKLAYHTGVKAKDPFEKDGPDPNDITAALFLLIRNADLGPDVFRCPSVGGAPPAGAAPIGGNPATRPGAAPARAPAGPQWKVHEMSNFPTPADLDYSIAQPYPTDDAILLGYKYNSNVQADFALAADKNPGGEAMLKLTSNSPVLEIKKGNSRNHASEGQNVLFNDGHVEFHTWPFAGAKNDNIYTVAAVEKQGLAPEQKDPAASVAGEQPQLHLDSVLLPRADDKPTGAGEKK